MTRRNVRPRLATYSIIMTCVGATMAGVLARSVARPAQAEDMTRRRIVYSVPDMDRVAVSRGRIYRTVDGESLGFDCYSPPGLPADAQRPAVILIHGGPIAAGMAPQGWGIYRSYGELIAASGLVAVTFKHRFYAPDRLGGAAEDVASLLKYVREHARDLHIDPDRLALWAFSGGGPLLSPAFRDPQPYIRCLVAYYAPLDYRNAPANFFGAPVPEETLERLSPFPRASKSPGPWPPIFLARAGRDIPWIKDSVDAFVRAALEKGLTIDLMNHPRGRHSFDILDADERSREIIGRTISYLREHLSADRPRR
jgi:acetyl esterase/lipase